MCWCRTHDGQGPGGMSPRRLPRFTDHTPKAFHDIAQGERSGEAAQRYPGFEPGIPRSNPEGVVQPIVEPLQGSPVYANRQPRAALRLPWALLSNRFAVRSLGSRARCAQQRGPAPPALDCRRSAAHPGPTTQGPRLFVRPDTLPEPLARFQGSVDATPCNRLVPGNFRSEGPFGLLFAVGGRTGNPALRQRSVAVPAPGRLALIIRYAGRRPRRALVGPPSLLEPDGIRGARP